MRTTDTSWFASSAQSASSQSASSIESENCSPEERSKIVGKIRQDPLAIDLHLCLMSSAGKTYRRESTMKPLPKFKTQTKSLDASSVFQLVDSLPSLTRVMCDPDCLNWQQLQFFDWVFNMRTKLETCKLSEVPVSVGLTEPIPDFIFKVTHCKDREKEFLNKSEAKSTFYALHGSRLENFHSILQFGLLGNLSKEGLFGEGVYLSVEQSVSMNHSLSSHGWCRSKIGSSLSCVAVCQVIDEAGSVLRGSSVMSKTQSTRGASDGFATSVAQPQPRSALPESYVLVKNGELVLIKYLLVYRTSRSRLQRRFSAIYDEYYVWLIVLSVIVLGYSAHFFYRLFNKHDSEHHHYLTTEYAHHHDIIV